MVPVKKVPVGCKTETSVNSWPAQTPRAHFSCDVVGGFGFAALPVLYNHVARAFNPSSSRRGQWPRAKHRLREPRPFYRYTVQYCFVRVRLPCVLRTFGRFPRVHHFRQKVYRGKVPLFRVLAGVLRNRLVPVPCPERSTETRGARAARGMFTQSGQVSARMQWPEASMTREDFGLFNKGELLHRDFSVFPDVGYHRQLSRQDAPAGHGAVTLLSPQVLASQSSVPRLPQLATTQRWQPFRTMEREPTPVPLGSSWKGSGVAYPLLPLGASGGLPPPPPQKWNEEVRELFPRTTMTVKRDKAQLAAQRSNERWEKRLAQRQASQAWLSSPELA